MKFDQISHHTPFIACAIRDKQDHYCRFETYTKLKATAIRAERLDKERKTEQWFKRGSNESIGDSSSQANIENICNLNLVGEVLILITKVERLEFHHIEEEALSKSVEQRPSHVFKGTTRWVETKLNNRCYFCGSFDHMLRDCHVRARVPKCQNPQWRFRQVEQYQFQTTILDPEHSDALLTSTSKLVSVLVVQVIKCIGRVSILCAL